MRWGTIQEYVDLCRAHGYFTPTFYATATAHMERIHVRRRLKQVRDACDLGLRDHTRKVWALSTGVVESTVHQIVRQRFCPRQQMAWTPRGAYLLRQIRTRVFNGGWEATFREWYPACRACPQPMAA
jgi:hypothetical protein